jgi:hypothetical protein
MLRQLYVELRGPPQTLIPHVTDILHTSVQLSVVPVARVILENNFYFLQDKTRTKSVPLLTLS